jgi:hypothetical protein
MAGIVAHIIHTYFTYSLFFRSFSSIYVDNFKSKVFPYVKLVVCIFILNEHTFEGDIVTSCAHEEIPLDMARKQKMVD